MLRGGGKISCSEENQEVKKNSGKKEKKKINKQKNKQKTIENK